MEGSSVQISILSSIPQDSVLEPICFLFSYVLVDVWSVQSKYLHMTVK